MQTIAVVIAGVASALIAIYVNTIYGLFVMAGDIVYVIVFPQLTAAVFCSWVNGYGSFVGFILGLILRLGAGEPYLNFDAFIKYPYYSDEDGQLFPFRTLSMMCNLLGIFIFSYIANVIFEKDIISVKYDFLHATQRTYLSEECADQTTSADNVKLEEEDEEGDKKKKRNIIGINNSAYYPVDNGVVTLSVDKF